MIDPSTSQPSVVHVHLAFIQREFHFRAVISRHLQQYKCHIPRHSGIGGTLALAEAAVAAVSPGEVELAGAGARVHDDGLADDETVGDELAHRLARVRIADLVDLVGVQPDLVLAAADHVGREPLLRREVDPVFAVTK